MGDPGTRQPKKNHCWKKYKQTYIPAKISQEIVKDTSPPASNIAWHSLSREQQFRVLLDELSGPRK
jgi:hypothetical protein